MKNLKSNSKFETGGFAERMEQIRELEMYLNGQYSMNDEDMDCDEFYRRYYNNPNGCDALRQEIKELKKISPIWVILFSLELIMLYYMKKQIIVHDGQEEINKGIGSGGEKEE